MSAMGFPTFDTLRIFLAQLNVPPSKRNNIPKCLQHFDQNIQYVLHYSQVETTEIAHIIELSFIELW